MTETTPFLAALFRKGFSLTIHHRTRSSVAAASSTDECPASSPPVWIILCSLSLTLQQQQQQQQQTKNKVSTSRHDRHNQRTSLSVHGGTAHRPCAEIARTYRRCDGAPYGVSSGHYQGRVQRVWFVARCTIAGLGGWTRDLV